jgi:uncharacterized membrane protein YbaN (DUF454 family)
MNPDPMPPAVTGFRRAVYVLAGLSFVGLAAMGAVLPILPTTPFLLLASYFFVRSSPALHRWLLRNRVFGPLLRDWQRHGGVRRRVKVSAVCVLLLALGASIALTNRTPLLIGVLLALGAIGLVVVLRLPVIDDKD